MCPGIPPRRDKRGQTGQTCGNHPGHTKSELSTGPEIFVRGCTHLAAENGITLNLQHDRKALVGRAQPFTEGRTRSKLTAQLPNTSMARDAVELVKSGQNRRGNWAFQSSLTVNSLRAGGAGMRDIKPGPCCCKRRAGG